MSKVELWTGLPGSGREDAALREAIDLCRNGKRVLWIVDRRIQTREIERKALAVSDSFLAGLTVLPAGRLALSLLEEKLINTPTLDVEERGLVLWELLSRSEINIKRKLSGGWERITVEAYKNLKTQSGNKRNTYSKWLKTSYPWINKVIQNYETLLANNGLLDESDLPVLTKNLIDDGMKLPWDRIYVNRLGPQQEPVLNLLKSLTYTANSARILVDYCDSISPVLNLPKLDYQRWIRMPDVSVRAFTPDPKTFKLATRLFTGVHTEDKNPLKVAGISYNRNRLEEVKTVADSVAHLVFDNKVNPEDIAIVCTDLEGYTSYLEDYFPRYGLKISHSLGTKLSNTPFIELAGSLLSLRAEGFEPSILFRALKNPLMENAKILNTEEIHKLEVLSKLAKIRWGSKNYEKSWLNPISELNDNLIRQQKISPSERRMILFAFASFAAKINADLDTTMENPIFTWLENLIHGLGVSDYIAKQIEQEIEIGKINGQALSMLYLVDRSINKMVGLRKLKQPGVSKYSEYFDRLVKQMSLKPLDSNSDGILTIGSLDLRGLRRKYVYFMGVTSHNWPQPVTGSVLDPHGLYESVAVQQEEFRNLTFELLANNETVSFSLPCPRKNEGEDKPSPFLEEIGKAGISFVERDSPIDDKYRNLMEYQVSLADMEKADLEVIISSRKTGSEKTNIEEIKRKIEIEEGRQNPEKIWEYNGFIGNNTLNDHLVEELMNKPWSVSKLDLYAQCPMKFFLSRLLDVKEELEVRDDLEPMDEGSLIHEILADANKEYRTHKIGIGALSQRQFNILFLCAEEHINNIQLNNAIIQKKYGELVEGLVDLKDSQGKLYSMIAHYADRGFEEAGPVLVEASFGMDEEGKDVLSVKPLTVSDGENFVDLAGRVDVIVFDAEKGYHIIDYKSGKLKSITDSKNGVSFQLPVYTLALEKYLMDKGENGEIFGADFFSIKKEESGKYLFKKHHQKHIEDIKSFILQIVKAVDNGYYLHPLSQNSKLCPEGEYNYCPYKDVCRKDHQLFKEREERVDLETIKNAYVAPLLKGLSERRKEINNG